MHAPSLVGVAVGALGTFAALYLYSTLTLRVWKRALMPFMAIPVVYLFMNTMEMLHLIQRRPLVASLLDIVLGALFVYGLYRASRAAETVGA